MEFERSRYKQTNMASQKLISVDLRPDRKLIDTNFDSYKLSLAPLPSYRARNHSGISKVDVTEDHVSYERIRCLTLHNYLSIDPWNSDSVYFVDLVGAIRRFHVSIETHIEPSQEVFNLCSNNTRGTPKLPTCIVFPSSTLCVASDGVGKFVLMETGDRNGRNSGKWIEIYKEESEVPCLIMQAVSRNTESLLMLDLILLRFEDPAEGSKDKISVAIDWMTLEKSENAENYILSATKSFIGKSMPTYVALSRDCSELFISSTFPFKHVQGWNTEDKIDLPDDTDAQENGNITSSVYKWKQTPEDLTVIVALPDGVDKSCVVYSLSTSKLHIALRNQKNHEVSTILAGTLYLEADAEASSWTIEGNCLNVVIQKKIEGHTWPMVVEGDDRGEMVVDPEEVARVHRQLEHLTSETLNTEQNEGALFNSGEIEECDSYYDSEASLMRFDATANAFTHTANVSSLKWLFNVACDPNEPPCVVLRHDVDAVMWQPTPPDLKKGANRIMWKHQATFNALGYVHASKTNVKYCAAAPDASFAALCECQRRVFVYRQPTALASPLRNRNSGEVVRKVSLQQVATLPSSNDVCGFAVSNERMFVLTENELVVFKVGVDAGA